LPSFNNSIYRTPDQIAVLGDQRDAIRGGNARAMFGL
jgi:hypothetical protein